jgi:hypothetical protein
MAMIPQGAGCSPETTRPGVSIGVERLTRKYQRIVEQRSNGFELRWPPTALGRAHERHFADLRQRPKEMKDPLVTARIERIRTVVDTKSVRKD